MEGIFRQTTLQYWFRYRIPLVSPTVSKAWHTKNKKLLIRSCDLSWTEDYYAEIFLTRRNYQFSYQYNSVWQLHELNKIILLT